MGEGLKRVAKQCGGLTVTAGGETVRYTATGRRKACPNCKEKACPCACIRNKCIRCGGPVGNITFTVCDGCWDKSHPPL